MDSVKSNIIFSLVLRNHEIKSNRMILISVANPDPGRPESLNRIRKCNIEYRYRIRSKSMVRIRISRYGWGPYFGRHKLRDP